MADRLHAVADGETPVPTIAPTVHSRILNWLCAAALIVTALAVSRYYFKITGEQYAWHFSDDAHYYSKIALHFSQGHPFTFDGLVRTNGFHPLWVIILIPFCWFTTNPESLTRAIFIYQYLIFLASAVVLFFLVLRISRGRRMPAFFVSLYFALAPYFHKVIINGLETPIFVLLSLASLLALVSWHDQFVNRPRLLYFQAGLVSAMILSRLEGGAFHALGMAVAFFMLGRGRVAWRRCLGPALFALAPIAFYLAAARLMTGAVLPVSGMVKRANAADFPPQSISLGTIFDFPNCYNWDELSLSLANSLPLSKLSPILGPGTQLFYISSPQCLLFGGVACLFTFGSYLLLRRCNKAADPPAIGYVSWFVVSAIALVYFNRYVYRFQIGSCAYWYFITFSIAQLLMWGYLLSSIRITHGGFILRAGGILAGLMLATQCYYIHKARKDNLRKPSDYVRWYETAKWIDAHLPSDARVGAFNAGILGLFSKRQVMNLDGLVNSPEFFTDVLLREKKLELDRKRPMLEFMQRHGIQYFADSRPVAYPDYYYKGFYAPGFPIELTELYATEPFEGNVSVVYRITYPGANTGAHPQ